MTSKAHSKNGSTMVNLNGYVVCFRGNHDWTALPNLSSLHGTWPRMYDF